MYEASTRWKCPVQLRCFMCSFIVSFSMTADMYTPPSTHRALSSTLPQKRTSSTWAGVLAVGLQSHVIMWSTGVSKEAAKQAAFRGKKKLPEALQIGAVERESGLGMWKKEERYQCMRNDLHELCKQPRKKTALAIKAFIQKYPKLALARDESSAGRGMTAMHILCSMSSLNQSKEGSKERQTYLKCHVDSLKAYLSTIPSVGREAMQIHNHDGRTPLFVLFQSPGLTLAHISICRRYCPAAFLCRCTFFQCPIFALVRSKRLTVEVLKEYILAVNSNASYTREGNPFLLPNRTNRRRTPLHEFALCKHASPKVLLHFLHNVPGTPWKTFFECKDAHGLTAFDLVCQNERLITSEVLSQCLGNGELSRMGLNHLCQNKALTPSLLEVVLEPSKHNSNRTRQLKTLCNGRDELLDTVLHILAGLPCVTKLHFRVFFKFAGSESLVKLDSHGDSPMHIYCGNEESIDADTLKELLDHVGTPTFLQTDKYQENIVHILMRNKLINKKLVDTITHHKKAKALLTKTNKFHYTGLHLLCCNLNVSASAISAYIKASPAATVVRDDADGASPLSLLCRNAQVSERMVTVFLKCSQCVEDEKHRKDKEGLSSLERLVQCNTNAPYSAIKACVDVFVSIMGRPYCECTVGQDGMFLWRRDTPLSKICTGKQIDIEAFKEIANTTPEWFASTQKNGRTTFHDLCRHVTLDEAAFSNYIKHAGSKVVAELLRKQDNYKETPLFILVRNKNVSKVMLASLLKRKNGMKSSLLLNDCGQTAFHILCASKHVRPDHISAFTAHAPQSLYIKDHRNRTAFHILCENTRGSPCLEAFLRAPGIRQSGILCQEDNRKRTPLSYLVRRHRPPTSEELSMYTDNGQDLIALSALTARDGDDCTPLIYLARRVQDEEIARGVLNTCLELWASSTDDSTAKQLCWADLKRQLTSAKANQADSEGECVTEDKEVPPLLTILGKTDESTESAYESAIVMARNAQVDGSGNTPLHQAVGANKLQRNVKLSPKSVKKIAIKLARTSPYVLCVENAHGRTPFEEAKFVGESNDEELLALLREQKLDDNTPKTVMHYAPEQSDDDERSALTYDEQKHLIKKQSETIQELREKILHLESGSPVVVGEVAQK